MSDHHRGDGSKADNSMPSRGKLVEAIIYYKTNGFQICLPGDMDERAQFPGVRSDYPPSILRLAGNHDSDLGFPESIIIDENPPILVTHGNQSEWICDSGNWLGIALIRYLWTPLEKIGIKEPVSPGAVRHSAQRVDLLDWANGPAGVRLVCGHTHLQENIGRYWNCGCCVDSKVQAVELDHGILTLVDWSSGERVFC
jgi:hypothetical protein